MDVLQRYLAAILDDDLTREVFNLFLALPIFPRTLYFDSSSDTFSEIRRIEQNHYDKQYQPVFSCSAADIILPDYRSVIEHKHYDEAEQHLLQKIECFHQSSLLHCVEFVKSFNKHIDDKLTSWRELENLFQHLKHSNGHKTLLCWFDVYRQKDSLQDIRLKYFRPSSISSISVTFSYNRTELLDNLINNIAVYWYPKFLDHRSEKLREFVLSEDDTPMHAEFHIKALDDFDLSRQHLVSVISYETVSGNVFEDYLRRNRMLEQVKYLQFLKGCLPFYDGFTSDTVDVMWVKRCSMKAISSYIMPGTKKNLIKLPPDILSELKKSADPPFEDLFDGAVEYSLLQLTPCLKMFCEDELTQFGEIKEAEIIEEEVPIVILTPTIDQEEQNLQNLTAIHQKAVDEAANLAVFDIMTNTHEFDKFKNYLSSFQDKTPGNTPVGLLDLECYIDIEKFKMSKEEIAERDQIATRIKQTYLTKRYFFGPISPAPRNTQLNILGGSGKKMPARPPSPILLEVQKHVLQRLGNKWVKQYHSTEDYQRRQARGTKLDRQDTRKPRSDSQFVFVSETKSRASAHEMLQLRKTLSDPLKVDSLKKFAQARSDKLARDIDFWIEVQKYKDMHHRHSSQSMIRKKIDTVIDCFLESVVGPKVHISVPPDVAAKTVDCKYDLGPYLFRQTQAIVMKGLCTLWTDYNNWCAKYEYMPLPFKKLELETQQKKLIKQLLRQKQRDEEKEKAFIQETFMLRDRNKSKTSRAASTASSTTLSDIRPSVERIEEALPTLHWRLSDTVDREPNDKEKKRRYLMQSILEKGLFKDDEALREYISDKLSPSRLIQQQIMCQQLSSYPRRHTSRSSRESRTSRTMRSSKNTSFDSTTSDKSCVSRSVSRSNFDRFDRTNLVSISEKLTTPSRNLTRRKAVSMRREAGNSNSTSRDSNSSVYSAMSNLSLMSFSGR